MEKKAYHLTKDQAEALLELLRETNLKREEDITADQDTTDLYYDAMTALDGEDIVDSMKSEYSWYSQRKEEDNYEDINQGLEPETLRRGLDLDGHRIYF